jgi:hypothetical protein
MKPQITETSRPLKEIDIRRFEQNHGRPIPAAYREFLLRHNGGDPDPCHFKIRNAPKGIPKTGAVKAFLGIDVSEPTLALDYTLSRFRDRVPPDLFPIARDPGGNLICIATQGAGSGKVYFWDHEFEAEEGQPPTRKNLYLIADSFEGFMEELNDG